MEKSPIRKLSDLSDSYNEVILQSQYWAPVNLTLANMES